MLWSPGVARPCRKPPEVAPIVLLKERPLRQYEEERLLLGVEHSRLPVMHQGWRRTTKIRAFAGEIEVQRNNSRSDGLCMSAG